MSPLSPFLVAMTTHNKWMTRSGAGVAKMSFLVCITWYNTARLHLCTVLMWDGCTAWQPSFPTLSSWDRLFKWYMAHLLEHSLKELIKTLLKRLCGDHFGTWMPWIFLCVLAYAFPHRRFPIAVLVHGPWLFWCISPKVVLVHGPNGWTYLLNGTEWTVSLNQTRFATYTGRCLHKTQKSKSECRPSADIVRARPDKAADITQEKEQGEKLPLPWPALFSSQIGLHWLTLCLIWLGCDDAGSLF